jgi:hypothetical protein
MIVIAVLALTIFHPGFCFPQLAGKSRQNASLELESLDDSDAALREREKVPAGQKSLQISTIGE